MRRFPPIAQRKAFSSPLETLTRTRGLSATRCSRSPTAWLLYETLSVACLRAGVRLERVRKREQRLVEIVCLRQRQRRTELFKTGIAPLKKIPEYK
ncbi:hypothetical protein [Nostoc sp.]|uniref:hypothetical protein n=1 Tax=Nostoc sp. TaxID=1180 RepID=UPI002FFA6D62